MIEDYFEDKGFQITHSFYKGNIFYSPRDFPLI